MATPQLRAVLQHIRSLPADQKLKEHTDGELLRAFQSRNDQAAFEGIVRRHGPMVLQVCRRVLGNVHDAEDAFQATFLTLAQRSASVRKNGSVASWLHGVGYRMATNARRSAARRRRHEQHASPSRGTDPALHAAWQEFQGLLHEAIEGLPEALRGPFVLCCLENKSSAEAASALGLQDGTVRNRLARVRKLLRERVARRGVSLTAALATVAVGATRGVAAVPPALIAKTVKAAGRAAAAPGRVCEVVSANVAAIMRGATGTMYSAKSKIATAVLLGIGMLAGGGVLMHEALARTPGAGQQQARSSRALESRGTPGERPGRGKADARQRKDEAVTVSGRVLGPDGKPFAGAKLYLDSSGPKAKTSPARATSGEDGRFQFSFAKSELDRTFSDNPTVRVLATAKGHGFDVTTFGQAGESELTLHLVRDQPISGRVLDQEGRPVAGARVRVTEVRAYKGEDLKEELEDILKGGAGTLPAKFWTSPLPDHPAFLTTAADGKFRLTGLGRERIVGLIVEGPSIEYARIQAMTRAGKPVVNPSPDWHPVQRIYGATFDYLAAPSRPIRGVVRDKETGKPVAGVRIETTGTTHTAQSDRDGRYELLGYAKAKEYHVTAVPAQGQPYFRAEARFPDAPGFAPLDGDIELVRGIAIRGRVTDKETGKPIRRAQIAYCAVYPNPNTWDGLGDSYATTGPDGSYTVVALPGPGLLAVTAPSPDYKYMPALVTLKEMKAFYKTWAGPGDFAASYSETLLLVATGARAARGLIQENYSALVLIEPDKKAERLTRDVALLPALTRKGSVTGPDGKPLAGATVYGLVPHPFAYSTLTTADFTVGGIHPKRTRQLLFIHKEKGLGHYQAIRGDEKGTLTVRLQPLGSASGRVVDKNGQPLPGLLLNVNRSRLSGPGGTQVKTDKEGRFRAAGLVPGQKYDLREANSVRPGGKPDIVVEPGKNKDLGDVTIDTGN
jgi:RNA polymerase sigma factor (sigma-70 family)